MNKNQDFFRLNLFFILSMIPKLSRTLYAFTNDTVVLAILEIIVTQCITCSLEHVFIASRESPILSDTTYSGSLTIQQANHVHQLAVFHQSTDNQSSQNIDD